MPRIDDPKFKKKPFKKQTIRAWDLDVIEKLTTNKAQLAGEDDKERELASKLSSGGAVPEDVVKQDGPVVNLDAQAIAQKDDGLDLNENKESSKVQSGFSHGPESRVGTVKQDPVIHSRQEGGSSLLDDEQSINRCLSKLAGLEEKVFFLVHDICIDRKSLETGDIPSIHFDRAIITNRNSRETAIKRLVKKGLIKRNKGKSGANGMLNLSLNEVIKSEALRFLNEQSRYKFFGRSIERSYADYRQNQTSDSEVSVTE